jgi:hypothetical protein
MDRDNFIFVFYPFLGAWDEITKLFDGYGVLV